MEILLEPFDDQIGIVDSILDLSCLGFAFERALTKEPEKCYGSEADFVGALALLDIEDTPTPTS